jgi:hypothetical protein
MYKNNQSIKLSQYSTIFCNSIEALDWAYKNGLPDSAVIKTNSPAMLFGSKKNIQNIESRWTVEELGKFQSSIHELIKEIFDISSNIEGIERELALTISHSVWKFQNIIYKASCLEESDFTDPRLFIHIDGDTSLAENRMNFAWDKLLATNPLFSVVNYTLQDDNWKLLSTEGISFWRRFKVAGYEIIIYRLAIRLMKKLPDRIFSKKFLVVNESELNIEIASSLAIRGVKISDIGIPSTLSSTNVDNELLVKTSKVLFEEILPVIRQRVEEWVVPPAVESVMRFFESYTQEQLEHFQLLVNGWNKTIVKNNKIKQSVLMNAPGNIRGHTLAYVCRMNGISLLSSQHGVTVEISKVHEILDFTFENTVADAMFSFNNGFSDIMNKTYYNKSENYAVGMNMRLLRMRRKQNAGKKSIPIIYISTNLYSNSFNLSKKTDYLNAIDECKLVVDVFGKLPHKVCYKTYPEDNRRYADMDPVLRYVDKTNNMDLFSDKIDMRYLISNYSVLVTTHATSTLGWLVMSGKPVVFINQKHNNPLNNDAYIALSKGLFVFDDGKDFHNDLRSFLSQPLDEIERLWQEKKSARDVMIKRYFSKYKGGAGKRAAKIILKEYLN